MIRSRKSREAKSVFEGRAPKGFTADLVNATRRRLERLDAAVTVEDLRVSPGHRLHKLSDDRAGQWSISVNDQFRICFVWGDHGPEPVEFVDHH
ncbi:MAG: type II toxin-antitoxin system RelE/ParE family toxin [Brevundimonas sp.]